MTDDTGQLPPFDMPARAPKGQREKRDNPPSESWEPESKRAVLYLRVSSPKQVATDYDPEGISLPAQRAACENKARQLGLDIVQEYVEPGVSGREMTRRVAFNEMLARIQSSRDVQYVLVYKLSRLNRNRIDDALVMMELRKCGVGLISATENIDDTPVGQLTHGILAAINEYRSAEDGADIRYKMGEKAKRGGTVSRAPLGYVNVGERVEDREVRTVKPDPERASFVRLAFELYATGDFTCGDLADELYERGLRTRATKSRQAGRLSDQQLARVLRDPYYLGIVRYNGDEYEGRHEALIESELFERVQAILATRTAAHERRRVHHHFLKGSVFCGKCHDLERESRMLIAHAKGNGGTYQYFFCRRRQEDCDASFIQVERIEDAIALYYDRLTFSDEFIDALRIGIRRTIDDEQRSTRELHRDVQSGLDRLKVREENLLDLAADGTLSREAIRTRMNQIHRERKVLTEKLDGVERKLGLVMSYIDAAAELLRNPGRLYRSANDEIKRRLNQALFSQIWVYRDGVDPELRDPMSDLVRAEREFRKGALSGDPLTHQNRADQPVGPVLSRSQALLHGIVLANGLSSSHLVDLRGLEPLTPSMRTRCATSCATGP